MDVLEGFYQVPFWVWPLLAVLMWAGLRERRAQVRPLWTCMIAPIALASLSWWTALGSVLGFLQMRRVDVRFDAGKVEVPGSNLPLILYLSIWCTKFAYGWTALLGWDHVASLLTGVLLGRTLDLVHRYARLKVHL